MRRHFWHISPRFGANRMLAWLQNQHLSVETLERVLKRQTRLAHKEDYGSWGILVITRERHHICTHPGKRSGSYSRIPANSIQSALILHNVDKQKTALELEHMRCLWSEALKTLRFERRESVLHTIPWQSFRASMGSSWINSFTISIVEHKSVIRGDLAEVNSGLRTSPEAIREEWEVWKRITINYRLERRNTNISAWRGINQSYTCGLRHCCCLRPRGCIVLDTNSGSLGDASP